MTTNLTPKKAKQPAEVIELSEEELKLSPNPGSWLTISLPGNLETEKININVLNANGRQVWSEQVIPDNNEIVLDFHDKLRTGVYVVSVKSTREVVRKQIMVLE